MKKNVLIVLIALSAIDLLSQVDKGNIVFSVDGNYIKTSTENGGITNHSMERIKNLEIETSVGYFMTDRFILGVGVDYLYSKETRNTNLFINDFYQTEEINIKSRVFMPNIYSGYYYPIMDKLYFNFNLKASYGKLKSDYTTAIAGINYYSSDTLIENTDSYSSPFGSGRYKGNSKVDFFSVKLFPGLTYFVSSHFGLCLGLGGIEYSVTDWKTDNSSWWMNINPVHWRFGIKIKV